MVDKSKINPVKPDSSSIRHPYLSLPEGWLFLKSKGFGSFITQVEFKSPDGEIVIWDSRYHRKHHSNLERSPGTTWWAPGSAGWWIGILFVIGSTLFALGSIQIYINLVGTTIDGITYFIGSIFFTSAAYLQYLETANAPRGISDSIDERLFFLTWEPKRIDWWATAIQFIGTLFFNITTFNALYSIHSIKLINLLVWSPDVYGSICFLLSSLLAWWEVSHAFWSWKIGDISWWIAALNLIGSVAFGLSAYGAYLLPSTNLPINGILVNLGTLIGAICFFIGGLLLLPERTAVKKNYNFFNLRSNYF